MIKTFLKNARQALNDKDNAYCISQCESALELDAASYHAHVFLALANTNLANYDVGEKEYNKAIQLDQKNMLAWQGLLGLFEKSSQVPKLLDTSSRIAAIHAEQGDLDKCLKVVLNAVQYARAYGSQDDLGKALRLILPVSPFFNILQDNLPAPADTYVELAQMLEQQESSRISSMIAKGRSRLGVRLDQLTKDVKQDIYAGSELEAVYGEIINWSHEEDVRREAEKKLLAHAVDRLKVIPQKEKEECFRRVLDLARGLTVVKAQNYLAWSVAIDWSDQGLKELDLSLLCTSIGLFPDEPLSQVLKLFFRCKISPYSVKDVQRFDTSETQQLETTLDPTDTLGKISAVLDHHRSDTPILCSRIVLFLLISECEWFNAVEVAENLLSRVHTIEHETGTFLSKMKAEINLNLATALTYHRAPKFYSRAQDIFEEIIQHSNGNNEMLAKIGKARILSANGSFSEAQTILVQVLEQHEDQDSALLELAKCHIAQAQYNMALDLLVRLEENLQQSGQRQILASVFYLKGESQRLSKVSNAVVYASYIQSLKYDNNYAPTYTALGRYYADIVGDVRRAEKCFQKALELSSGEIEAAERLATTFANDGDWELVEIIAQRVIQGNEQLKVYWPYRAIGFVHLHTGKHQQAISAFQAGLRLATQDVHAWIGLGESYLELGRFQAAEKAFLRALKIDPLNWYARYLIASVWTAIGLHSNACEILETLVREDEKSYSLKCSLGGAYTSWGEALLEVGKLSKAAATLEKCLNLLAKSEFEAGPSTLYNLLGKAARMLAKCHSKHVWNEGVLNRLEDLCVNSGILDEISISAVLKSHSARYAVLSAKAFSLCIDDKIQNDADEAVLWHDIGLSLLLTCTYSTDGKVYKDAAIAALKCAVKLDPTSDVFWAALGTSVVGVNDSFAQHCFVKAISIDDKSAIHWANLGFFYFRMHHLEAANQAFRNAQTRDPSSALAWLGQASIAHSMGESDHELFEHAYQIGNSTARPVIALKFAESAMQQEFIASPASRNDMLSMVAWAAEQAKKGSSTKAQRLASEYAGLRAHELLSTEVVQLLSSCTSLVEELEQLYEEDESADTLDKYCDAKALQARCHLRQGDLEIAQETAISVIELEPLNASASLTSCRLVLGISQYLQNEESQAVATLQEMLQESDSDSDVRQILAQILASGSDENGQTIALELLEDQQDSAQLQLLLAAIVAFQDIKDVKYQKLARQGLSNQSLISKYDSSRTRIERVLERPRSIEHGLIHQAPETSCESWLRLAKSSRDSAARAKLIRTAMQVANQSHEVEKIAMVCNASDTLHTRLVGLHLSPEVL